MSYFCYFHDSYAGFLDVFQRHSAFDRRAPHICLMEGNDYACLFIAGCPRISLYDDVEIHIPLIFMGLLSYFH